MRRTWIVVIGVVVGCGPSGPTLDAKAGSEGSGGCGPGTCNGCCQGNSCRLGVDNATCGIGGLPCVVCPSGETCADGQCIPFNEKCNPGNCKGCCQGEICVDGTQAEACGRSGVPCVACASSQKCENQSCGCGPTTCNGCCDNGVCRSGTETAHCGKGGSLCTACTATQACQSGICKTGAGCSSTSCTGCCAGADCKAGNELLYCGAGGHPCVTCASGETCTSGVCNNPATCSASSCSSGCCQGSKCLSGTASSACGTKGAPCKVCGAAQTCQSSACKLDLTTSWGITVVEADLDTSKGWDPLIYTEPDPFVEIAVGGTTGKTTTKGNTYTPQWDELIVTASASAIVSNGLQVKVLDADPWGTETIGACVMLVPADVLLAGYGVAPGCGNEGWVKQVELKFTLQ